MDVVSFLTRVFIFYFDHEKGVEKKINLCSGGSSGLEGVQLELVVYSQPRQPCSARNKKKKPLSD